MSSGTAAPFPETTLTAIGDGVPIVPPFDLPAGYPMTEIDSLP